ncbi:MAG: alpha/beta hydrolase [Bacteroidota bacterium]
MTLLLLSAMLLFLRRFIPKGNALHEVLSLPSYLLKVYRTPTKDMKVEKHFYGKHRRQYLLWCTPLEGVSQKKHVIVYHHGGGWAFGSPEMLRMNAQYFVRLGYSVILPSYRRSPKYRLPEMWEDLMGGLHKGLELMAENGLGERQLILAGMSAGGNLAALCMYRREAVRQAGLDPERFRGLMLFGAPLDLRTMARTPILYAYCGSRRGEMFQQANPIEHLEQADERPVLCVHGTSDGMVPFEGTQNFMAKQKALGGGNHIHLHVIEQGTHLDAGSWGFEENDLRPLIGKWLENREKM